MEGKFKEFLYEEYGEELAEKLIDIGVDNLFKLKTMDSIDMLQDDLIKISYINHSERFNFKEYDKNAWNLNLSQKNNLRRVGYSDSDIHKVLRKNFSSDEEYDKFNNWSRIKMSNDKINKTAKYGSGITPSTNYTESIPGSSFGAYSYGTLGADNLMGIDDEGTKSVMKAKEIKENIKAEKSKAFSAIDRYIRGLSKTLQSKHIDWNTYSEASQHLFNLMDIFKKMKSPSMQATAVYDTANAFGKLGLKEQSNSLRKVAQQIQGETTSEEAPTQGATDSTAVPVANQDSTDAKPADAPEKAPVMPEAEPVDIRTIKTPGPAEGEYEGLLDVEFSIDNASKKLDEVAGMLADRRVIRMLAEFDIILDKLGIASMFPELAESQSKLIDSFSYALTRVSKMMGQLSNAKDLMQSTNAIPGVSEKETQAPEETEEAIPAEEPTLD